MATYGPAETVSQLIDALNKGNLEAALALYEPQAVMVAEPGRVASGKAALRKALEGFVALRPTIRSVKQAVVESGDLAQYCGEWTLAGTDPAGKVVNMAGKSSDVLRRQKNGTWKIVVDNPWGTGILG
ncbi:MAG: YybH family protein [Nitrospirota bacterium]